MSFLTVKQSPAHPCEKLQKQPGGSTRTITRSTSGTRATMSRRPGTQPDWEFREAEETSHLFVVFALSESLNCISSLVIIDLAQEKTDYYRNFLSCPIYCKGRERGSVWWVVGSQYAGQAPSNTVTIALFPCHYAPSLPTRVFPPDIYLSWPVLLGIIVCGYRQVLPEEPVEPLSFKLTPQGPISNASEDTGWGASGGSHQLWV